MSDILIYGSSQSNFLLPIYKYISEQKNHNFFVFKVHAFGHDSSEVALILKPKDIRFKYNKIGLLKGFLTLPFSLYLFFGISLSIYNRSLVFLKNSIKRIVLKPNFKKEFKKYDVIHLHYCHPSKMQHLWAIEKNQKLICSIWGSDILKQHSVEAFAIQKEIFDRANIITIQSVELRQLFLSKYGFHLKEKIKVLQFGISDEILDNIKFLKENKIILEENQEKLQLKTKKIRVVIGYNKSKNNNHIPIIEQLFDLEQDVKDKILLIVPFAYGNVENEYVDELKYALNKLGISFKLMDQFLVGMDLATLRISSDIFIHLPDSDALSNSLAEVLYARNKVITGTWLPYDLFRKKADKNLITIDYLTQLRDTLVEAIKENYSFYLSEDNTIENFREISVKNIVDKWSNLYE